MSTATEAGGVLLGARRGPHLEITDLTTPYPRDVRKRTYFDRRDSRHNAYAYKRWLGNNRKVGYLGEWHTHPERTPSPSTLDIGEWRQLVKPHGPDLVFLIVGTDDIWLGLGGGRGLKPCASRIEVDQSEDNET